MDDQIIEEALDYELKKKLEQLKLKHSQSELDLKLGIKPNTDTDNATLSDDNQNILVDNKIDKCEIISNNQEKYVSDQYIKQLMHIFTSRNIITNDYTIQFVNQILHELPVNLVNNLYEMYQAKEIIDLKYKKKEEKQLT